MNLKTYRITLTTIAPVFVGNGKKYEKNEYLKLPDNKLGILNINKMLNVLYEYKQRDAFEKFMMDSRGNLDEWLKTAKFNKVNIREEIIKNCVEYTIENIADKDNKRQIMSAVKDAYGNPYIPGSSLKGALRSVLATYKIATDDRLRERIAADIKNSAREDKPGKNFLSGAAERAEIKIFHTLKRENTKPEDAVNDIMQGFIVGDSSPISRENLISAQKIDRHTDGAENPLPIVRESIRPNTKIEFLLTVDESICGYTIKDILKAVDKFDELYNENFLKKFKGMDILRPDKPQIFIGGGAGFVSKTLVYPILGYKEGLNSAVEIFNKTLSKKIKEKHKHFKDKGLGVSPHTLKCTNYDGQTLQMGLCEFQIDEVN